MKTTEGLINQIVTNHVPVKRDLSPAVRLVIFVYILPLVLLAVLYLIRPFELRISREVIALFIALNLLTYLGLKAFAPGENKIVAAKLAFGSLVLVAAIALLRIVDHGTMGALRPLCEIEAIGISVITTLFCHLLLRKNEFACSSSLSNLFVLVLPLISTVIFHGICYTGLLHVFTCHILSPLLIPALYIFQIKKKLFMSGNG